MNLSVVVPLLNEEESLHELYARIDKVCQENQLSYEIWFVDDGSTDSSWQIIENLSKENHHVHGIKFSRNYGKSQALHAAFEKVQGDVVITMDADLQDFPEEIPELYSKIVVEKYDLVSGWKKKRFDNVMTKNLPSKLFNSAARNLSGVELHDFNCGLKAYRKQVVKSVDVYGDLHRWIPVLAANAGFKRITEKPVQHQARPYGTSKFGTERFIRGFSGFNYALVRKQIRRKTNALLRSSRNFNVYFRIFLSILVGSNQIGRCVLLSRLWKFNRRKSLVLHCINYDDYGNIAVCSRIFR